MRACVWGCQSERWRATEAGADTDTETERDRERQRETERDGERQRETERDRERQTLRKSARGWATAGIVRETDVVI